ncbi:hypothetical protein EXU57_18990 [Segetibacter sp. 3557_3]|uniref:hypothetical protein n=1 Tax=Segetibacter sp. 3557_3 TaxID=2547429 RepID=UPI0010588D37|nr:hypothetical protein [Segetibacter sp. 3557_3]TDH21594.1 hypothetical protein EXU57_18990 [Segetibacter sp. 3557_3]
MKRLLFSLYLVSISLSGMSQIANCTFKPPQITINFGSGYVSDFNTAELASYRRVSRYCPSDGYYTYTPYTSDCFRGDWLTLWEDHTPGDDQGNMLLVNASHESGTFFNTSANGLHPGKTYEFGVWMMNVCRISEKCPFPLLPEITIRLQTASGKLVAQFGTGELIRRHTPEWTQYRAQFTAPAEQALTITMINNSPGGCGNDFALDDITFRECVRQSPPPVITRAKPPVVVKKTPAPAKPSPRKPAPVAATSRPVKATEIPKPPVDTISRAIPTAPPKPQPLPPPPAVLTRRANPLIKQFEIEPGEIKLELYDNGEIDGDTVTIYHNNKLLVSNARLSQRPISFKLQIDPDHPHHELVMVAENLGSIPPNTSLMVVTTPEKRYEVFISSTDQKNAKVVFNLKQ